MEWPREGKVGEGEDRELLFGWQLRGRRNQREKAGRECWCYGRVSLGLQWLRWRNGGARWWLA